MSVSLLVVALLVGIIIGAVSCFVIIVNWFLG